MNIWDTEKDYEEFKIEEYHCIIKRGHHGALLGYVGVNKKHVLYEQEDVHFINCHGGVTFTGFFNENKKYWYIGFDCAHAGDLVPSFENIRKEIRKDKEIEVYDGLFGGLFKDTYKDWNYVKSNIEDMCKQLKDNKIKLLLNKGDVSLIEL